jgi:hypothetical protein
LRSSRFEREYEVEPNAPDWRNETPSDVLLALRLLEQLAERQQTDESSETP